MDYAKAFSFYCRLEWGLKDVTVLSPHLFTDGKRMFVCDSVLHTDSKVTLPNVKGDVYLLMIPNKEGDNFIAVTGEPNEQVSFTELAKRIKYKTRFERVTTDDLLPHL